MTRSGPACSRMHAPHRISSREQLDRDFTGRSTVADIYSPHNLGIRASPKKAYLQAPRQRDQLPQALHAPSSRACGPLQRCL